MELVVNFKSKNLLYFKGFFIVLVLFFLVVVWNGIKRYVLGISRFRGRRRLSFRFNE